MCENAGPTYRRGGQGPRRKPRRRRTEESRLGEKQRRSPAVDETNVTKVDFKIWALEE